MVNKFLIVIVVIAAVMIALVAAPGIGSRPAEVNQDLSIEYSRQNLTKLEDGRLVAATAEDLVIKNDRSAVYRNITAGSEIRFTISTEELENLKGLVISTGFMQVPGNDYAQKEGLANLTKYTLELTSVARSKAITWVDLEASGEAVPSIVRNIGAQLDEIIERRLTENI
jgi:hypothetical protein